MSEGRSGFKPKKSVVLSGVVAGNTALCTVGRSGNRPSREWVHAMHTSLILYAEHEFNASTFAARVIAGTSREEQAALLPELPDYLARMSLSPQWNCGPS